MTGVLIVNKPAGWTSHDVVAKLRRALGQRRIGHGGTLDPMATGVLPVFVGRATRAVEFLEGADKAYIAELCPGIQTDTQDTTGTVLASTQPDFTLEALQAVLRSFLGEQEQLPPLYSAVKVNGRKLYEYARTGQAVERRARKICIREIELLHADLARPRIRVVCSKGTYIRTLCSDIGEKLGCGAAMSALVRTRAGAYTLDMAHTLTEILEAAEQSRAEGLLLPVDSIFAALPRTEVSGEKERRCRNGNAIDMDLADGRYRVYGASGAFLLLGEVRGGVLYTVKSFFEVEG